MARAHRPLARKSGNRHQAAHSLNDLIESGAPGIGAVLAKTGYAHQDHARVDLLERLVIQAETLLDIRTPVLGDDIRRLDHALEYLDALWRLEVESHRALVAVQVLKVAAHPIGCERRLVGIDARGRFDTNDVGAEVCQHAHAGWTRTHAGQVEDPEILERG